MSFVGAEEKRSSSSRGETGDVGAVKDRESSGATLLLSLLGTPTSTAAFSTAVPNKLIRIRGRRYLVRMQPLGQFRVFAGHYQFILCDAAADPLDDVPDWDDPDVKGYVASPNAAFIDSQATLNNIVVRVALSDRPPDPVAGDRQLMFNMSIPSGKLHVTSLDGLDEPDVVPVPPGDYSIYVLSFNLGVDEVTTGELLKDDRRRLTDAERFARLDFEHHEVILIPIRT